ncbi:hypothetical protein L7F22_020993 [Adiantum nelumboides]|nr:hypothetical protein [Adiantum nelumboides]
MEKFMPDVMCAEGVQGMQPVILKFWALPRVAEEELALEDEVFKARLVELEIDKYGRNTIEPNKIDSDMGGNINLEHEGHIKANEMQKIELLDGDKFLGRVGGSRATSKYTGHALIHYQPQLDKYVFCAFHSQIPDHHELPMFAIKTLSRFMGFLPLPNNVNRVAQEELALKDEVFETRLVELEIDKYGRNIIETNKIDSDMGAKNNLDHEGHFKANELQKIELLDEDNILGRVGDEAPISLDSKDSKELSMQDLHSTEVEKEANIGGEEETRLHEQQEWIQANIGGEEETRLHEQQEWIRGDLIVAGYTPDEALKALNTCAKVQEHEVTATYVEPTTKTTVQEPTSVDLGTSNTTVWEATSVKPTTKTIFQELTSVRLGTSNTTVWEAISIEPTTKTTVQELTSVELGTSNTTVWVATSVKPTTKNTVQELTFFELGTSNTTVWEVTSVKPTTKTIVQEHEVTTAATSIKVTAKLEHKATTVEEHKAKSHSSIAEDHNAATVEAANVDKLEEATPDIDGDNLKMFSFIPVGFKMRKYCSRPTHNGFDLVHLPKTRSGSK